MNDEHVTYGSERLKVCQDIQEQLYVIRYTIRLTMMSRQSTVIFKVNLFYLKMKQI